MKNLRLWRDLHKARKRNIGLALIPAMVSTIVVVAPHAYAAEIGAIKYLDGKATTEKVSLNDETMQPATATPQGQVFKGVYVQDNEGRFLRVEKATLTKDGKRIIIEADKSGISDDVRKQLCDPNVVQLTIPNDGQRLTLQYISLSETAAFQVENSDDKVVEEKDKLGIEVEGDFDSQKQQLVPLNNGNGAGTFTVTAPRDVALTVKAGEQILTEIADNSTKDQTRLTFELPIRAGEFKHVTVSGTTATPGITNNAIGDKLQFEVLEKKDSTTGETIRTEPTGAQGYWTVSGGQVNNGVATYTLKNTITELKPGSITNQVISSLNINGQVLPVPTPKFPEISTSTGYSDKAVLDAFVQSVWDQIHGGPNVPTTTYKPIYKNTIESGKNAGLTVELYIKKWVGAGNGAQYGDLDFTRNGVALRNAAAGNLGYGWANHFDLTYEVKISGIKQKATFDFNHTYTTNPVLPMEQTNKVQSDGFTGAAHIVGDFGDWLGKISNGNNDPDRVLVSNPADKGEKTATLAERNSEIEIKRLNGSDASISVQAGDGYGKPTVKFLQGNKEIDAPATYRNGRYYVSLPEELKFDVTKKTDLGNGWLVNQGSNVVMRVAAEPISLNINFGAGARGESIGLSPIQNVNVVNNFNITVPQPARAWQDENGRAIEYYKLVGVQNDGTRVTLLEKANFGDRLSLRGRGAFAVDGQGNPIYKNLEFEPVFTTNYLGASLYWVTIHDNTQGDDTQTSVCGVPAIPGMEITVLQDDEDKDGDGNGDTTIQPTNPGGGTTVVVDENTKPDALDVTKVPTDQWGLNPRVGVANKANLKEIEKAEVTRRIIEEFGAATFATKDGKPDITIAADGSATVVFRTVDANGKEGTTTRNFAGKNLVYQEPTEALLAAQVLNPREVVGNLNALTVEEQGKVKQRLEAQLAELFPAGKDKNKVEVSVDDHGAAFVKVSFKEFVEPATLGAQGSYQDNFVQKTIRRENLVRQALPADAVLSGIELDPRVGVVDKDKLTKDEQETVKAEIIKRYTTGRDGQQGMGLDPSLIKDVTFAGETADATVIFNDVQEDGTAKPHPIQLDAEKLVRQLLPEEALLGGLVLKPLIGVEDIDKLTDDEKTKVSSAIRDAYQQPTYNGKNYGLEPAQIGEINVSDTGSATVQFKPNSDETVPADVKTVTLPAKNLVYQLLPGKTDEERQNILGSVQVERLGVHNLAAITEAEQNVMKDRLKAAYKEQFNLDASRILNIEINPNGGNTKVTFSDYVSVEFREATPVIELAGSKLFYQKTSEGWYSTPAAGRIISLNPRVGVNDVTNVTPAEAQEVKDRIVQEYARLFNFAPEYVNVTNVAADGSADVTLTSYDAQGTEATTTLHIPGTNLVAQKVKDTFDFQGVALNPRVEVANIHDITPAEFETVLTKVKEEYKKQYNVDPAHVTKVFTNADGGNLTVYVERYNFATGKYEGKQINLPGADLVIQALGSAAELKDMVQLEPPVYVNDADNVLAEEGKEQEIIDRVKQALEQGQNIPTDDPRYESVKVNNDGSVDVTFTGMDPIHLDPEQIIFERIKVPGSDWKMTPLVPVSNKNNVGPSEIAKIKEQLPAELAEFGIDPAEIVKVDVAPYTGAATVTFKHETSNKTFEATFTPDQLITEKIPVPGADWNLGDDRVPVVDKTNPTAEEKEQVAEAVKDALGDHVKDVTVNDDGTVTVTYDGETTNGGNTVTLQPGQVMTDKLPIPGDDFELSPRIVVADSDHLTDHEREQVESAVRSKLDREDLGKGVVSVRADEKGNVTITYSGVTTNGTKTVTIPADKLIKEQLSVPDSNWSLNPLHPVKDPSNVSDEDAAAIAEEIFNQLKDEGLDAGLAGPEAIKVGRDGAVTITYDGVTENGTNTVTLKPEQVITQAQLEHLPENFELNPKVQVEDANHLTAAERDQVEQRVAAALAGADSIKSVDTDDTGRTTVTYFDGTVQKIAPERVIQEIPKQQQTPEVGLNLDVETGRVITGSAPAGTEITVTDPEGNEVAKVTVGDDGHFSIPVPETIGGNVPLKVTAEKEGFLTVTKTFVTTDVQKEEKAASSSDYLGWLWLIPVILGLIGAGSYWAYVNQVDGGDRLPLQRGQANPADYIRWIQGLPARESGGLR